MLQIGDLDRQYVIDTRFVSPAILKPILESNYIAKCGVNLKFEAMHLAATYGWRLNNLQDTMLQEQVLHCGRTTKKGFYSMAGMAKRYLGYNFANPKQLTLFEDGVSKDTRLEFRDIGMSPFTIAQIKYGAGDLIIPLKINVVQQQLIKQMNLQNTVQLENDYCLVVADMELNGMPFNIDI